jgi:hypothetical protein
MEPLPSLTSTSTAYNDSKSSSNNVILRHDASKDLKLSTLIAPPILLRPNSTPNKVSREETIKSATSTSTSKQPLEKLLPSNNSDGSSSVPPFSASMAEKWLEHHKKIRRNIIQEYFTSTKQQLPLQNTNNYNLESNNQKSTPKYTKNFNWETVDLPPITNANKSNYKEDNFDENEIGFRRRSNYSDNNVGGASSGIDFGRRYSENENDGDVEIEE